MKTLVINFEQYPGIKIPCDPRVVGPIADIGWNAMAAEVRRRRYISSGDLANVLATLSYLTANTLRDKWPAMRRDQAEEILRFAAWAFRNGAGIPTGE